MMKTFLAATTSVALALAFGASATTAVAQTEIKIPLETPAAHIKTRTAEVFKAELEKMSAGKYKVTLYPAGQLMAGKDEVPAVARGQVQMAMPTIGYVSTIEPAFKLLETPMLFDSYDSMETVLNGPVGADLLAKLGAKRLMGAGFWYDGFVALWSNKPIRTLADFKDKKIRVFPSEVLASSTEALGAAPTAIPGAEVFLALKQGVADGAWTTAPYGNDALAAGKAYNLKEITNSINNAYKNVAANGMEVVEFSAEERTRWIAALKPLYDGLDPEIKALLAKIKK